MSRDRLAAAVVAYALSPLDLIPDFIPVVGYLDDLIIVPAGIALVLRFIPSDVMVECRERAGRRGGPGQKRAVDRCRQPRRGADSRRHR